MRACRGMNGQERTGDIAVLRNGPYPSVIAGHCPASADAVRPHRTTFSPFFPLSFRCAPPLLPGCRNIYFTILNAWIIYPSRITVLACLLRYRCRLTKDRAVSRGRRQPKEDAINTLKVLFYSASLRGIGKRFYRIILSHIPQDRIEICRSIAALDSRLHKPLGGLTIAAFHIHGGDELEGLIARRDLLADFRTILLLPDSEEDTTARGHLLRPRFVVYGDGDLADASVVLGKMLQGCRKNGAAADLRYGGTSQKGSIG